MSLLLLLALTGCSSLSDLTGGLFGEDPPPPPPKGVEAPKPAAPADPLADAKKALRTDAFAEATAAAEKAVAADPTSDAAWDLLELSAVRGGAAGALLDRLAADQAIGGRVDRHMGLRARLALEANRPADALISARALEAASPGDAAALVVRAVRAGAPTPADASPVAQALLAAMADPKLPLPPEVAALTGPEVALLRAERAAAAGDRAAAAAELAALPTAPLAVRTRALAVRGAWEAPAATVDEAVAVSATLAGLGDVGGAADALTAALSAAGAAGRLEPLFGAASTLRADATTAQAGPGALAAAAVAVAETGLRAGHPKVAHEAAAAAAAEASLAARARWSQALAAAALGDPLAVDGASEGLTGPRQAAVADLARALRGANPTLPTAGLTGDEAALQALIGAGWLSDPAPARAAAAAAAVSRDLALWAALEGSSAPFAWAEPPAPLAAELSVRAWLTGGGGGALADTTHPQAAAWAAVLTGGAPAAGSPASAVTQLRQALGAGDAAATAAALSAAAAGRPAWRSGPLAPLLSLDGPGVDVGLREAGRIAALSDGAVATAALHAWAHPIANRQRLWGRGVGPFAGATTPEARAAVFDAAAALRAGTLAWALGGAPWPADAARVLGEAATAAGLPSATLPSLADLRGGLGRSGLLSFLETPQGISALYVSADRASARMLPGRLADDVRAYNAALATGKVPLQLGDAVRSGLIDSGMDVLTGIGNYVVVGGAGAGMVPVVQLPEQVDGLRFLASIRTATHIPDFTWLLTPFQVLPEYPVTALALCASADEADLVRGHWPDVVAKVGAEATVAAWRESAGKARYLHLGDLPAAPGGGFVLPSGETLTLADIAATPLGAMSVVISGTADAETTMARVAALRQAGVGDVLAVVSAPEQGFGRTLLSVYWDGINKRRGAGRSFAEGRIQAVRNGGPGFEKPGTWGTFVVASAQ